MKVKYLFVGGRLTLINFVLVALPTCIFVASVDLIKLEGHFYGKETRKIEAFTYLSGKLLSLAKIREDWLLEF